MQQVTVATDVAVSQELRGYFLKNTYSQTEDIKLLVIKDEAKFNEFFGVAKTMTNKIIKPDFNTSIVAAVAMKASQKQITITMDNLETESDVLNAFFKVETGAEQTFSATPVYLFIIDKSSISSVKKMQLLVNGKKKGVVTL